MEKENNIVKTNEKIEVIDNVEDIKHKIYTIRGKQVMLDSDVADLYHYETKRINEAVNRNKERFPENFCFKLTEVETENLKSQIVISNLKEGNKWSQTATTSMEKNSKYRGKKYVPYAFTEQGIAMLSGILKNKIAVQVSINIMNAFVEMRKFIAINGQVFERLTNIEYKLLDHDKKFDEVFNELQERKEQLKNQNLFFEGQIWDAYNLIITIIKKAEKKILIIDNYIDDTILDMLSKKNKNVEVVILTSNNSNISNLDIQKFNKEYPTLKLAKTNKFHDRFIVIDDKELYHCGASLKDLGKKCFAITKMEDIEYIENLKLATSGN